MKHNQSFKRDNLLLEFIREHKGKCNAVKAKQIAQYLAEQGYPILERDVRHRVQKLIMERCVPICSASGNGAIHGFYWASSRNEIEETIAEFQSRINGLQERIDALKSFIL